MKVGDAVRVRGTKKPIMTVDKINSRLVEIMGHNSSEFITTSIECFWFGNNQELFRHRFSEDVLEVINE